MTLEHLLGWMICGLIVGACARILIPGSQSMSLMTTMLLGIVGALLGGFLFSLFQGPMAAPFSLTNRNWYGWGVSILGAVLVVWVYPQLFPRRWWQ